MKSSPSYSMLNSGQNGVLIRHLGQVIVTNDIPEWEVILLGEFVKCKLGQWSWLASETVRRHYKHFMRK